MASIPPTPAQQQQQQQQQQPNKEQEKQNYLDLGITLALNTWPALSLAVSSNWGGPTSADKRDWLCGAISDMLTERAETDAEDLEDVLVQVMNDEFDVVVDDESAAGVAVMILNMKEQVKRGKFEEIKEMWEEWEQKRRSKSDRDTGAMFRGVGDVEPDQEQEQGQDSSGEEEDAEMGDAPGLVSTAPKEKIEPEVDEEGFTKVAGKKKR